MENFMSYNDNTYLLEEAAALADEGRNREARSLVKQAIGNDKHDAEAWWALTHLAASDAERNHALEQVLMLEPENPHALHMRDQIRAGSLPSLDIVTYQKPVYRKNPKYRMDPTYIMQKDYTLAAVGTLFAYMVFWIAGLGLNIYFLHEARQLEENTGIQQKNAGCLQILLGVYVILPLVSVALFVILAVMGIVGS